MIRLLSPYPHLCHPLVSPKCPNLLHLLRPLLKKVANSWIIVIYWVYSSNMMHPKHPLLLSPLVMYLLTNSINLLNHWLTNLVCPLKWIKLLSLRNLIPVLLTLTLMKMKMKMKIFDDTIDDDRDSHDVTVWMIIFLTKLISFN